MNQSPGLRIALRDLRRTLLERGIRFLSVRRQRLLAWRSLALLGVQSVTVVRDGAVWCLENFGDSVEFHVFVDGGFQRAEIRAVIAWLRRNGFLAGSRRVVVDVGAHIGTTSIPFAMEGGCRVVAIEPSASHVRQLEVNVGANGLREQILVVRNAVLRAPARVTMCVARENTGGTFVMRDGAATVAPEMVADYETVDGDGLVAILSATGIQLEDVALVWADVQGCEGEVIESGAGLWALGVPFWAEVEPHSLLRQGPLESFVTLAEAHFNRFIASHDLITLGAQAPARPIAALETLIRAIPLGSNTDILLLPPACNAQPLGAGTNESR